MVVRPVYNPPSDSPASMQYPSSESGQEGWQSAPKREEYSDYQAPEGPPPYWGQNQHAQSGPYGSAGGETARYYGNAPPPNQSPSNWSDRQYPPQQAYGGAPYQQPYQSPPQGPYGNEHQNSNPFGQPPSAPPAVAPYGSPAPSYGSPAVKEEEGVVPPGGDPQAEGERGLMGALAGAAAGGYAGHKMHHGFIGTLGGAYAGHKLEDAYKDHKKHSAQPQPPPPNHYGPPPTGPPHYQEPLRGNFSASSVDITLDRDHDLIASCSNVHGHRKLSSISLNNVITNDDGHFRWVSPGTGPGNFGGSARDVRLVDGGRVLEAELRTCNGDWRRDRIRLDEKIENSDGDLRMI